MRDISDDLKALKRRLEEAAGFLKVDDLRDRQIQLETEASRPDLWDNPDKARQTTAELAGVHDDLELYDQLAAAIDDVAVLWEMAKDEGDDSLDQEIDQSLVELVERFDSLELRSLFSGEHDEADALCEVHSGAGGTESQDWAEMLLRMYLRWAEEQGFTVELDSVNPGGEAGITSASFIVRGRYAYGLLQAERGVHRLVRISPFDSNARRHTSFASMAVIPFLDTDVEVNIDEKDLRIDTYRSSGAGGQHVNVTDSAVRITHLPTGLVTSCQNERSQRQNKERAMAAMAAKLADLERQKKADAMAAIAGEQREVAWGSQIRSYVLHPYQMVKDLRSDFEVGNPDAVLDGEVGPFMEAYLRWRRGQELDA